MGAPMASNLVGHVDQLLVHDISPAAVDALVAKGAEAAGSAAALGEKCEIVFTSLPTPPIVREAVRRSDRRAARRGSSATFRPRAPSSRRSCTTCSTPRGIASFDAPVSGGIRGAEQGTLAIMVGGPEALWPELEPLLDAHRQAVLPRRNPRRRPGRQARQQPAQPRRDRHHRRGDGARRSRPGSTRRG